MKKINFNLNSKALRENAEIPSPGSERSKYMIRREFKLCARHTIKYTLYIIRTLSHRLPAAFGRCSVLEHIRIIAFKAGSTIVKISEKNQFHPMLIPSAAARTTPIALKSGRVVRGTVLVWKQYRSTRHGDGT